MKMERIFITGNAGAGKSTLSKKVSEILGMNNFGLDAVVWKAGWNVTPSEERIKLIAELIKPKTWIVDGVSKEVLKAADTIVFLDFPRRISYWRVLKRNWRYLFKSRPELPENCLEILIIRRLMKIIWDFRNKVRPSILNYIDKNNRIKNVFHLCSNKEVKAFIRMLEAHNKTY